MDNRSWLSIRHRRHRRYSSSNFGNSCAPDSCMSHNTYPKLRRRTGRYSSRLLHPDFQTPDSFDSRDGHKHRQHCLLKRTILKRTQAPSKSVTVSRFET
jgi:hypothetical protein